MDPYPAPLLMVTAHDPCLVANPPREIVGVLTDKAKTTDLPCGRILTCPPCPQIDADDPFDTLNYTWLCIQAFRGQLQDSDAFYYIQGALHFSALRAAVLALRSLTSKPIGAPLHVHEENRCFEHNDCLAALVVLQRIGLSMLVVSADTVDILTEAVAYLAPEAQLQLAVCCPAHWITQGMRLPVQIYLPHPKQTAADLLRTLPRLDRTPVPPAMHEEELLVSDGKTPHYVDITADISEEIPCDHRLSERLIEQEDEGDSIFKLLLEEDEDVNALAEHQYMITRPICLCADSAELLDRALHVFSGIALYDGTWELEPDTIAYFTKKYGMMAL